jgi:hypothetical protein
MTRSLQAGLLLLAATACAYPTDQTARTREDTGSFEVVRERTAPDGRLELRVRAENLDEADRIARKLVESKKSANKEIAKVEFIALRDPEDGPARRTVQNP